MSPRAYSACLCTTALSMLVPLLLLVLSALTMAHAETRGRGYDGEGLGIRKLNSVSGSPRELVYSRGDTIITAKLFGHIDQYAYWFIDLLVGTPQQRTSLIVDTGSTLPGFTCEIPKAHVGNHIDPHFDINKSSTAKWLSCDDCPATFRTQCREDKCYYHQSYTEGSSIEGYWFEDYVSLDDHDELNPAVMTKLGCHTSENKLFYTQKANGIMGMAPSRGGGRTVLETLFDSKENPVDKSLFSMCLATWGGQLVVGGYNATRHTSSVSWAPMSTDRGYYYISIQSLGVYPEDQPSTVKAVTGAKEISTDQASFGDAMVDSGTTYTYLPTGIFNGITSALDEICKDGACGGATRKDRACWVAPGNDTSSFPVLRFTVGGKHRMWYPMFYMYNKANSNTYCYTFEDNHAKETVLGASWMQGHDIIFDLEDRRLGWATADCPQYVERPEPVRGAMPPWMNSTSPPMQTQSPVKPPKKEGQSETEKTLRPTPRPDAMMAASPALSDLSIAIVVAVAGLLVTAACCVMCYGWRNRKRGGVYQLGVTQEPYSHRFGDTDDDWSSSASSEQPHDIEEGDGSRSREMDLLGEEERPTGGSSSSSTVLVPAS